MKKSIDLIANDTSEAKRLIKDLSNLGFEVNHIYTGCEIPALTNGENFIVGANNIRMSYLNYKEK